MRSYKIFCIQKIHPLTLIYNHTYTSCEMFRFCKHHHDKVCEHPHVIPSHHDKSHDFQTSFTFFRIFKKFGHAFVVVFHGQYVRNFFSFDGYGLKLG